MIATLSSVLPFFALVCIGFIAARFRFVTAPGIQGLNTFVFFFALPALLFEKGSEASVEMLMSQGNYVVAYFAATLCVFAIGFAGARAVFKAGPGRAALMGLGGSYSNVGFMALPVLITVIGDWVAVPLAVIVLLDVSIFIPLATTIIDLTRVDGHRKNLGASLIKSVLKNPLIIATLAGLTVAVLGTSIPKPVGNLVSLLSGAAGPVAMFALGAVLAGRPVSDGLGESIYVTVFKLTVHPLAMWWFMTWLGVGADWRLAATLGCALPTATSVFIIAQEYNVMPARTSTAILLSTIVSVVTLTLTINGLAH